MNINQTRQIRSAALPSALAAAATMVASPAMAQPSRTDHGPAGVSDPGTLGFATPLAALGGRTPAQYVEDHQQQEPPYVHRRVTSFRRPSGRVSEGAL